MMLLDVIGLHQVINVMACDVDVTSGMSWHKYMVVISKWWLMIPHDLLGTKILALHVSHLAFQFLGTLAVRRKLDFEQGTCGICKQGAWLVWMGRMGPIGTGKGIKWSAPKMQVLHMFPPIHTWAAIRLEESAGVPGRTCAKFLRPAVDSRYIYI